MKRILLKIAKRYGVKITEFKSYRSDMGCQVYDVRINGQPFTDSYFVGEAGSREKVITYFEIEMSKII